MNSLLKNTNTGKAQSSDDLFKDFDLKLAKSDLTQLDLTYSKLKYLGMNFDPFSTDNSSECSQVIKEMNLEDHFQNPYLATNILLKLLDMTEEKINSLKQ